MANREPSEEGSEPMKLESRDSIDKVREILFGPLQREQQSRFLRIERALQSLESQSTDQLQATKAILQARIEELSGLGDERNSQAIVRLDALEATARRELSQEVRALTEQLSELRRSLREEFSHQVREMERDLRDMAKRILDEVAELRKDKTNREDLADYLLQVSLRLRGDPDLDYFESTIQRVTRAEDDGQP